MGNRGRQLSKKQRDPAPFSEEKWIAKKGKDQNRKSTTSAPKAKKPIVKNKKRKSESDDPAPSKKQLANKKQKPPIYESEEEYVSDLQTVDLNGDSIQNQSAESEPSENFEIDEQEDMGSELDENEELTFSDLEKLDDLEEEEELMVFF